MNVTKQERPKTAIERTIVLQMSEDEWVELCNALYAAKDYYRERKLDNLVKRTLKMIDEINEALI